MIRKNDLVIARKTDKAWGHVEGDTLKVRYVSDTGSVFAKNITRPHLTASKRALLLSDEYEVVNNVEEKLPTKRVYFLGIPILTIKETNK